MRTLSAVVVAGLTVLSLGCKQPYDEPYQATPAPSGRKPNLPGVPALPTLPLKAGESWTVYGATHHINSDIHRAEVAGKKLTIEGYIVESNIPSAPACALHEVGKKDPDDCKAEVPRFAIADKKGDTSGRKIGVLGWARNFAVVFEAEKAYHDKKEPPKELVKDDVWGVDVPFPLPAVGAKVRITGTYDFNFTKSTTGMVSDPDNGILTFEKIEVLEPAETPASFANKK